MIKKYEEYKKTTKIIDFFDDRNIEIYTLIDNENEEDSDIIESFRMFIERVIIIFMIQKFKYSNKNRMVDLIII